MLKKPFINRKRKGDEKKHHDTVDKPSSKQQLRKSNHFYCMKKLHFMPCLCTVFEYYVHLLGGDFLEISDIKLEKTILFI